jgi:two-component system phosphate regulon sensor histidine kinase PhoR
VGPRGKSLVSGLSALLDTVNAGGPGLPALQELLRLAQSVLGADGMTAFELIETDGRIIAATGDVSFALGRRVDAVGARAMSLRTGRSRVQQFVLDPVITPLGAQLVERGIGLAVAARAELGGQLVGAMSAYYRRFEPLDDPDGEALISLFASAMAHLYADHAGLPVHGEGGLGSHAADLPERDLFMAVTSHELRTPVTVIKGYADTLNRHWDELDEPMRREAAHVIGQRADELAKLVDRLLMTATLGGPGPSNGRFDLVAALRQAAVNLPADLRHRLRLELPDGLPMAHGERSSIATVLTELVTNAYKYSAGSESVVVTAAHDSATVLFQVLDRGVGVREDERELAFEQFWRGERSDTSRPGGAGLGLYLVRKTIERQNGWVSLHPRDGGGTVAEVRLPRGDQQWSGEA